MKKPVFRHEAGQTSETTSGAAPETTSERTPETTPAVPNGTPSARPDGPTDMPGKPNGMTDEMPNEPNGKSSEMSAELHEGPNKRSVEKPGGGPTKKTNAKGSGRRAGQHQPGSRIASRGGVYALLLSAIVLAILIVVNIFTAALPANLTQFDISAAKLYSVTGNTREVVNGLTQDVTINWIVQAGEEDDIIENLLAKYESLSDHITVEKIDPDVYPTFAAQYTTEEVQNNSLVVVSGDRSRYVAYDDIYVQDVDIYAYTYTTSFDGEGMITSAINYVVTDDLPLVYILTGHGEEQLPETLSDQMAKENLVTSELSLVTEDAVPADADCVLLYAPASDISELERDMLQTYVQQGGRLLVMAGPVADDELENLHSLLAPYGVSAAEGIVVDTDGQHFAMGSPLILLPTMEESEITDPLREENFLPQMPLSRGLIVDEAAGGRGTVTPLLTTSAMAFSKIAGFELTDFEKEEGDIDGPFTLAVSIEDASGGQIAWFSSSLFVTDEMNAYASGANVDMAMNAMSSLIGERQEMNIRSKSLNYNYLNISESAGLVLKVLMIGVFPLAYLGIGILVVLRRRRKQNEAH